jgi:hypothetical protein
MPLATGRGVAKPVTRRWVRLHWPNLDTWALKGGDISGEGQGFTWFRDLWLGLDLV